MNTCYYIIYNEEGEIETIPDPCGGESDYSYDFFYGDNSFGENDWTVMKQVQVKSEYWVGYFFFNDMDEPEDKDECDDIAFNSMEHLDIYWSNNDSGGHYDCLKIEHWVDGDLKEHFNPDEFEQLR